MNHTSDDKSSRFLRADLPEDAARSGRCVRIATIQLLAPSPAVPADVTVRQGLALLEQALASSPDVVCLPEHFNCMDYRPGDDRTVFTSGARQVLQDVARRTSARRCAAVVPVVIDEAGRRYNRAYVIDRAGVVVGHFDKVHVTQIEREEMGIEAGTNWPVFDLDFGRVGVMICYDGCFTEPARILALEGAEIIFWPSLQRSYTKDQLELQTRAHALFNYVVVVRSSYGGAISVGGVERNVVGFSCVCAAGGEILTSIENRPGWAAAPVDLGRGPHGSRTFGGEVGCLREMRLDDRCPHTYDRIAATRAARVRE